MHEPHEMSYDAELLDDMLNSAAVMRDGVILTAKALSLRTGYATQTISDYRRGRINIPVRFWRLVWNLTRDLRVANLLLADTPCEITFSDQVRDIADSDDLLQAAVDSLREFHQQEAYLLEILKDNRIDEADRVAIDQFNLAYARARQTQTEVHRAINRAYADRRKECA